VEQNVFREKYFYARSNTHCRSMHSYEQLRKDEILISLGAETVTASKELHYERKCSQHSKTNCFVF
jgi:hypothetical protein